MSTVNATPLTAAEADAFLDALAALCDAHGVALGSREAMRLYRVSAEPEAVRDRRRYRAADPDDGDLDEYDATLYVTVSAGALCADRIRRDTGFPHHFCLY